MSTGQNCSTQTNESENKQVCTGNNVQDTVPISPVEKVAAFSVVYGVLFLIAVVGKYSSYFYEFLTYQLLYWD